MTALTRKGWKLFQDQLLPVSVRVSTKYEVEGLRPCRASLTEATYSLRKCKWEYEDSLGLTASGSYLFR
ncbi:hypothetical protein SEA_CAELUM_2 [Streptomyces phage Caelum]|uniref:Uncharacterized protein n=1 Tax=Streptomyces phage Caelum TaxID=2530160 RepID=A0A481W0P2_9CAUD|nr:hypothetical protein KGG86_gp02 [Streptomyces phage Caelum]QBI99448.1 hypothetical protein SEA_CAELUM_2 [Streptomyces phage Caelum]